MNIDYFVIFYFLLVKIFFYRNFLFYMDFFLCRYVYNNYFIFSFIMMLIVYLFMNWFFLGICIYRY